MTVHWQSGKQSVTLVSRHESDGVPVWPITLKQVKDNAQIDDDCDDELLHSTENPYDGILPAAVVTIEEMGRVALIEQQRRRTYDYEFPGREIELPFPPLISVESIKYLDSAYVSQTIAAADYRAVTNGFPGRVALKKDKTWPTPVSDLEVVQIDYTCGYGKAPKDVPVLWKRPIIVLATYWYEHPEAFSSRQFDDAFERSLAAMVNRAGRLLRYV